MSATATSPSSPNYSRHASVGVILLLIAVAVFVPARLLRNRLAPTSSRASDMRIVADIQAINTQLELYHSMNGFYPTTKQGLQALVTQPVTDPKPRRWYQLFREKPQDPWQNDYIYRCPGVKNRDGYDVFSPGPDHKPDTADDNWGG
jgi:general secretion pathway protein G